MATLLAEEFNDKLVRSLRENGTSGEKLCEINSATKWYAQNVIETPIERGLVKVNKHIKENKLLAVPFDKGNGFLRNEEGKLCATDSWKYLPQF